ncbi:iron efflux ABC transporter ATP-binding subunit FetA [Neisseria sp. Ec49-e6-T10]|uniref:iron efflux ABC transporter ATP-binding subunit FetA n=1 Tax=Neisseria sp. Ec49-e6-T10 TaxID=3140744 RepID=UPI003EBC6A7D
MSDQNNVLELRNITFKANDQLILDQISVTLAKNEFKVITGPSGCGKSTLLKIASSLLAPTSGDILFKGQNIQILDPQAYRKAVSYCFQTPMLFGETVMDNLSFPYQIRKQQVDQDKILHELTQFNLDEGVLTQKIDELSGGEKQRIALLRNLQFLPEVLLLDEITSALDETNKKIIHDVIFKLVDEKELCVMWVTHDANEIKHSNNVLHLNKK